MSGDLDGRFGVLNSFFMINKKEYEQNKESDTQIIENTKSSIITLWLERWFFSSNAKDIGTLYLIFALFSGLIGTAFSVLIRLELSGPGVQYISDNQLYNSIITAHAIVMIFFMVEKTQMLTFLPFIFTKSYSTDVKVVNNNNQKDPLNSNHNYTKVVIENPYDNRYIIARVAKKQKGVYVWETLDNKNLYVGHSINLYNRICSYFMPSILKTKERRVLRFFNKYGFNEITLTIYIMKDTATLEEVVKLEQHFIDTLNPNLNVDLVASSSGYYEPMSLSMREELRKKKGTPVFIYDVKDFSLLHIFESKTHMYGTISIHHKTLDDCIDDGKIYLDSFFLSLDPIEQSVETNLLNLDDIKTLVTKTRETYIVKHPSSKAILAEFKDDYKLNKEFSSLNLLAKELKGDRKVIRDYLKGTKSGYYRGKWKFTYINAI